MIEINLIPAKLKKAKQMQLYIFMGGAVGVVVLLVLFGVIYSKWRTISKIEKEIRRVDAESASLRDKIEEVRRFNAKEDMCESKKKVVDKLLAEQALWPRILDDLGAIILPDMWFSYLGQLKEKKEGIILSVIGYAHSKIVIADFMKRLEQLDNVVDIKATYINQVQVGSLGTDAENFEIQFMYKTGNGAGK